jgi:hypothetical protein
MPTGGSMSLPSLACMDTTTKAAKRAVHTRVAKQLEPQLRQMKQETAGLANAIQLT